MTHIPYRQDTIRWLFQLRRAKENRAHLLKRLSTMDPDRQGRTQLRLEALEQDILNYRAALFAATGQAPPE